MLEVDILDKLIIQNSCHLRNALHLSCTNLIKLFHVRDVITTKTATILVYKEVVASMTNLGKWEKKKNL